jgi:hypothetical protein
VKVEAQDTRSPSHHGTLSGSVSLIHVFAYASPANALSRNHMHA